MNIDQILLLKLQRFCHTYQISIKKCVSGAFQNWEVGLLQPSKQEPSVLSTEEALSILYSNNQILLFTEQEILKLLQVSLNDYNHINCELGQEWFNKNYEKCLYTYYVQELKKILREQMINKEIIIYDVKIEDEKPQSQPFINEYYNREGMEFAKSLK